MALPPISGRTGVDAVQAAVHPDLQLIGILHTHPLPQLLDRRRSASAIFLEHFEQRARALSPSALGVPVGSNMVLLWHGSPPPRHVDHGSTARLRPRSQLIGAG